MVTAPENDVGTADLNGGAPIAYQWAKAVASGGDVISDATSGMNRFPFRGSPAKHGLGSAVPHSLGGLAREGSLE